MSERYALLIGAMKAGTTALHHALLRHPEIAPCREKEPAFWISDEKRRGGLDAYRALWDAPAGDPRWRLEGSTGYTKFPVRASAAPFLRLQPAEFRFVYLVRNPLRRIRSQYVHSLAEEWIRKPIFEELDPRAVWFSNYRVQLQPYVDFFGRDAILVLSHEELITDQAQSLRRVCAFLDIDPEAMPLRLPRANDSNAYRDVHMQRSFAAIGLAPAELLHTPSPRFDATTLIAEARGRAAALGRPELVDTVLAELEREVTPGEAETATIHAALDDDLLRFEEDWGLDPWTGRRLVETPR